VRTLANVFDLWGKISIDTSGFTKALSIANKAITMSVKAIADFARSSVQTGMTFDKSMSQVAATLGKTVDEVQDLREFAQKMGSETAFSASQSADALNYMALAGYDAEKSMKMLPNVLNLAAAGTMDLARASDMITDTQTAFGMSIERTTQMVDEMAKAASTGNTSVSQLGDAFLVVGGLTQELNGGIVNLADGTTASVDGIQELEIALTGMANAGIKGSEAGTHMRNMLLKLSSPSDAGAKQMEALGVSVFNAEGKMRSLSDIFSDLSGALGTLTQEQKIQAISDLFNARDIASAEALLSAVEQDWDKIGESILNADGAAKQMAETQLDNLAGDVTIFRSALEGIQIALSDKLTPTLRKFVQFGTSGISNLTKAFKEKGLKGAMDVVGETISDFALMIVDMAPDFFEAVTTVLSSIRQGLIDNLPAILDVAVTLIKQLIQDLGTTIPQLMEGLPMLIKALADSIDWEDLFNTIVEVIEIVADTLIDVLPILTEALLVLLDKIVAFLLKPEVLTKLVELTAKIIIAVSTALMAAAPKLLIGVGEIVETIIDYIINTDWNKLGQDLMDNIQKAISKAAVKLSEWWDGWSQAIAQSAVNLYNGIIDGWNWFWGQWTHGVETMWNGVLNSWNWFWGQWKHGIDTMWNVVVDTFGKIGDFFKSMWDGISWIFTTVGTKVGEAIGGAFKAAINAVIWTVEGALNLIPNAVNGAIDLINKLPGVNISAIPTVTLPRLAQGGVLKKGQVGYLEGDGDEAVVPLSQNTQWIDRVADKISEKSGNSATYIFNFNIDNVNGNREDMEDNADLLMQIFTEKMSRRGVVFA
jgi:TP901 family phage tail tape measure protein